MAMTTNDLDTPEGWAWVEVAGAASAPFHFKSFNPSVVSQNGATYFTDGMCLQSDNCHYYTFFHFAEWFRTGGNSGPPGKTKPTHSVHDANLSKLSGTAGMAPFLRACVGCMLAVVLAGLGRLRWGGVRAAGQCSEACGAERCARACMASSAINAPPAV